jgi:hypothetical protein
MRGLSVDLEVHHIDEEGGGNQQDLGSDTAIQLTKPNQTKPNHTYMIVHNAVRKVDIQHTSLFKEITFFLRSVADKNPD